MPADFRLDTFRHPLRSVKLVSSNTPDYRQCLFGWVGDYFHEALEDFDHGRDPFQLRSWMEKFLKENVTTGDDLLELYRYSSLSSLLPMEVELLLRIKGDTVKADQVASLVGQLKTRGDKDAKSYLVCGEFSKGIMAAHDALKAVRDEKEERHALGIISRCHEMLGDFSQAIEWRRREISKGRDSWSDEVGLARLYLKTGEFARAGEAYLHYTTRRQWEDGHIDSDSQLVVALLYILGGDKKAFMEMLWDKSKGCRFPARLLEDHCIPKTLEEKGFFEELAKISGPQGAAEVFERAAEKYHKAGNKTRAIEMWKKAAGEYALDLCFIHKVAHCFKQMGHVDPDILEGLVAKSREKGKLQDLAEALQKEGFYEEAARIYEEMGQGGGAGGPKARESKIKPRETKEKGSEKALIEDTSEALLCPECGARIRPHWVECPSCHVSLQERRCRKCGEPLEPDWDRCPVCKTTGTHLDR